MFHKVKKTVCEEKRYIEETKECKVTWNIKDMELERDYDGRYMIHKKSSSYVIQMIVCLDKKDLQDIRDLIDTALAEEE